MPLSPPSIVAPLSACSDKVHLQGQLSKATVRIFASPNNIWEEVFFGQASGPDQIFKLHRRLQAGETVRATQSVPGDAPGPFSLTETVEPEPDPSELGLITAGNHIFMSVDSALHLAMASPARKSSWFHSREANSAARTSIR